MDAQTAFDLLDQAGKHGLHKGYTIKDGVITITLPTAKPTVLEPAPAKVRVCAGGEGFTALDEAGQWAQDVLHNAKPQPDALDAAACVAELERGGMMIALVPVGEAEARLTANDDPLTWVQLCVGKVRQMTTEPAAPPAE